MTEKQSDEVRRSVRESYAAVADAGGPCCGPSAISCCAPTDRPVAVSARRLGYSEAEIEAAPEGANMGLGCGNPTAIASLKAGETVLDLDIETLARQQIVAYAALVRELRSKTKTQVAV